MKNINAISFTPKYDELEDRIRISINYDDFQNRVDLMLTRSLTIKLFPVFDEYILKFYDSEITPLTQSKNNIKEKILKEDSTSITDNSNLELYKQEDELLIEVKFSYIKNTKQSVVKFLSKDSEVTAQLDLNSIKQIFTIIKSSIPFFTWGISHNF